nr:MAG TPA: hypothetical protein [Caudoviricetes sp.]
MILTSDNGSIVEDKDWVNFINILLKAYDLSHTFHKEAETLEDTDYKQYSKFSLENTITSTERIYTLTSVKEGLTIKISVKTTEIDIEAYICLDESSTNYKNEITLKPSPGEDYQRDCNRLRSWRNRLSFNI